MTDRRGPDAGRGGMGRATNRFRADPMLPVRQDPLAHAAEEYRKVVVQIDARRAGKAGRVLMVLSPLEAEGKTVTATNLALALAETGARRVLLVDFDLRRPRLEPFLHEQGRAGLADVLRVERPLEEVVQRCRAERLDVMTAGSRAGTSLGKIEPARIEGLLEALRRDYDWIVADCPPLLPFAESRTLASLADDVVLVVRAEVTPRSAVTEALGLVEPERFAGVVLNAVPEGRWMRYGYRYAYRWRGGSGEPEGS